MARLSATDKARLDRRLLLALRPGGWHTADQLANRAGGSDHVEPYVVNRRLWDLRRQHKVERRSHRTHPSVSEWRIAEPDSVPVPVKSQFRVHLRHITGKRLFAVVVADSAIEARTLMEDEPYVSSVSSVRPVENHAKRRPTSSS